MAKLSFNPSVALPVNRRGGLVHYAVNQGQQVARALAIPLQPKNTSQNNQQNNISNLAALWKSLSTAVQASWTANAVNDATGYGWFIAFNSAVMAQNYPPYPYPPALAIFGSPWYFNPGFFPAHAQSIIEVNLPATYIPHVQWDVTVYIQLSDLSPYQVNGAADGAPVGQAPASGYVFLKALRSVPSETPMLIDMTADIETLFGQPLTPITMNPTTRMYYGSWVSLGVVLTVDGAIIGASSNGGSPARYNYGPFYNPSG